MTKYYNYCDCNQQKNRNKKDRADYGAGTMKKTTVDGQGICVYCGHVAVVYSTLPSFKKCNNINSRHIRDKSFSKKDVTLLSGNERSSYFYEEYSIYL